QSRCNAIFTRAITSLRDTLGHQAHSRDFDYARSDYLCSRVTRLALVFLALLPFWTIIDWFILPDASLKAVLIGRIFMVVALIVVLLMARCGKTHPQRSRLAVGLLFATPALFYALVLAVMPERGLSLVGYGFIPY